MRLILGGLTSPVLLDGAWATQLQTLGLDVRACPDAWNLTHPEQVTAVARSYVEAGSEVILTNTFGANRVALSFFGMTENVAEINRAGVQLSRAAAGGRARVFASIGPSRKSIERAEVSEAALVEAFLEQSNLLADAGADALVLETFTQMSELRVAIRCAKTTGLPTVACIAIPRMGSMDPLATDIARRLLDTGVDAIGINCCAEIGTLSSICARWRELTDRPLWFKPNAGTPTDTGGRLSYPHADDSFNGALLALLDAGADLIGGCCGTSPDTVKAMARIIAARSG